MRTASGSIHAMCDGIKYHVFTVFSAQEGKVIEVARNCAAPNQCDVLDESRRCRLSDHHDEGGEPASTADSLPAG